MTTLATRGLRGGYASADDIVCGVDLEVSAGELVVLIGPNGAGKSTFLRLVAGLLRPREGSITVDGRELAGHPPAEVARMGVALMPQEHNVFAGLTIEENLELGAFALAPGRAELRRRMAALYDRFPLLAERRRAVAGTLSGGQRQRLALALALMASPRVLLLDEPTAGLAPNVAREVLDLVRALATEGLALLVVEQNALAAMRVADRACVLVQGRKRHEGPASLLAGDPEVRRTFLGG